MCVGLLVRCVWTDGFSVAGEVKTIQHNRPGVKVGTEHTTYHPDGVVYFVDARLISER